MDLNQAIVFIKVVQNGSFTKAAQELGMPVSTVSEKVTSLERRLGVTLIQRTTRKLSVTPVGQAYFKKCILGFEEFKAADSEVMAARTEPQGLFKITASPEFGVSILPNLVSKFIRQHPKVEIETVLTQRNVDFLNEEIDIAIRVGKLSDSSLIAKKVGSFYFAPFAAPAYLKRNGTPSTPKDLTKHSILDFIPLEFQGWEMTDGKKELTVEIQPKVRLDDTAMLKQMTINGDGVALIPTFSAYDDVKAGNLVRILPGWYAEHVPVHLVYPSQRFVGANLSSFMKMADSELKSEFEKFAI